MCQKKQRGKKGFSLIETMVSMVVLVTLVIGGSAALQRSGGTILQQQKQRDALAVATTAIENMLRGSGFDPAALDQLAMDNGGSFSFPPNTISVDGTAYSVTTTVDSTYDAGDVYLYIRVKVSAGSIIDPVTLCFKVLK